MRNKFPFVEVIWLDHNSDSSWENINDYLRDAAPETCISRGWLIKKTSQYIVIASGLVEADESIGGRDLILRSCIESVTELNCTKKRKRG